VGVLVICVLVFIVFCIALFMYSYYFFICTTLRTTATECKLAVSSSSREE